MTHLKQLFDRAVASSGDRRGKPAKLGRTDGTLYWTTPTGTIRRDKVWARIGESASNQEAVVRCTAVTPQIDMPVRVDMVNGVLSVVSVDEARYLNFSGNRPGGNIGAHAWLHGRLGPDPLYLEGLQFLPLLVHPSSPPALTVTVEQGAYRWEGTYKIFETAASGSLSAYVPASTATKHFVIICLDRATNALVIVDGDDVAAGGDALFGGAAVTADDVTAVSLDPEQLPLAAVLLYYGQTEVRAADIVMDLRQWGNEATTASGGGTSFADDVFEVTNAADDTKVLNLDVSGVATGTVRTLTVPNASGTIALTSQTNGTITPGDLAGTGDEFDIIGFTATDTIGVLTPASDPGGANEVLLKTNASGNINLQSGLTFNAAATIATTAGNLTFDAAGGTYQFGVVGNVTDRINADGLSTTFARHSVNTAGYAFDLTKSRGGAAANNNDQVGVFQFRAMNTTPALAAVAYMIVNATNVTAGAETGQIELRTINSGANSTMINMIGNALGFYGATPVAKQTVTGSRGGNAALADLLTKLATLGLIVNSTS